APRHGCRRRTAALRADIYCRCRGNECGTAPGPDHNDLAGTGDQAGRAGDDSAALQHEAGADPPRAARTQHTRFRADIRRHREIEVARARTLSLEHSRSHRPGRAHESANRTGSMPRVFWATRLAAVVVAGAVAL